MSDSDYERHRVVQHDVEHNAAACEPNGVRTECICGCPNCLANH